MANKKNNQLVQKLLDKNWFVHVQHANGIGTDELDFSQNLPKSISAAETFLNDSDDFDEISKHLKELTSDVVGRLRKYHLKTKTITIYVKYPNFTQQNKSLSISTMTDDFETIWLTSINIFQRYFINKLIRLIGIKLDHFATPEINLFSSELWEDAKEVINKNDVEKNIIKIVNDKFKRKIIDIANNKLK
jgi:DNA polymerase-4